MFKNTKEGDYVKLSKKVGSPLKYRVEGTTSSEILVCGHWYFKNTGKLSRGTGLPFNSLYYQAYPWTEEDEEQFQLNELVERLDTVLRSIHGTAIMMDKPDYLDFKKELTTILEKAIMLGQDIEEVFARGDKYGDVESV